MNVNGGYFMFKIFCFRMGRNLDWTLDSQLANLSYLEQQAS